MRNIRNREFSKHSLPKNKSMNLETYGDFFWVSGSNQNLGSRLSAFPPLPRENNDDDEDEDNEKRENGVELLKQKMKEMSACLHIINRWNRFKLQELKDETMRHMCINLTDSS